MSNALPWKRIWITGAGRGIGRALATLLCEQGAVIYASSRTPRELQALADDCESLPGQIIPVTLDITDADQVTELCQRWSEAGAFPDLVVLNAGTHDPFPAQQFSAGRVRKLFEVNFHGTVNCIDPVLRHFCDDNRGHLAVMASVAGYRGLPTAAAYGAGKAALINLCEALKLDLTGTAVKVQVINPGFVRTPLTDKNAFRMPALLEPEEAARRIVKGLLSDRFEITFPKRFVYALKLLRMLPYCCYFRLISRTVKTDSGQQTAD